MKTSATPQAALRTLAAAAFILTMCGAITGAVGHTAAAQQPDGFSSYTETFEIDGQSISFDMVPIPGGRFTLGSPEAEPHRYEDEGPRVELEVAPFWMSRTEVTWELYDRFMAGYDGYVNHPQHRLPAEDVDAVSFPTHLYEPGHTFEKGHAPDEPAVTMTHFAARQFTKWLSLKTGRLYRLPTETEWEYAARAGSTTAYHFGNDAEQLDQYGWNADNSDDKYQPVAQLKPNAFGLYDMHGNVAEWTLDTYDADRYSKLLEARITRADLALNPTVDQYPHVIRGGSWFDFPEDLRSAARRYSNDEWSGQDPQVPNSIWWHTDARFVGIRLLRPTVTPTAEQRRLFWEPIADMDAAVLDLQDKQVRVHLDDAHPLPPSGSP